MRKAIKFAITGGVGCILDFFLTWFFKERVGLNQYLANCIGFSAAVLNNFCLNKFWTFSNKEGKMSVQFGYFVLFSLVGLGLNTVFLFLFTHYFKLHFYLSKCIAIALVFIWNFNVNNFITFKNQPVSENDEDRR